MRVGNEYTSLQNRNYQRNHSHHITECLHEEQTKKTEGGMGPSEGSPGQKSRSVTYSKDGDSYQTTMPGKAEKREEKKSAMTLLKGFWDSLGEEGEMKENTPLAAVKDNLLSGIHAAAASIKTGFQEQVVDRVQKVPARVKQIVESAGSKLGKRRDAFSALMGGQTPAGRRNPHARHQDRERQMTEDAGKEEIPAAPVRHSHLMDSYSRNGEYCQLNENLSYNRQSRSVTGTGVVDGKR